VKFDCVRKECDCKIFKPDPFHPAKCQDCRHSIEFHDLTTEFRQVRREQVRGQNMDRRKRHRI
jgi:hypothetical protein